jgi:hypothetical protein
MQFLQVQTTTQNVGCEEGAPCVALHSSGVAHVSAKHLGAWHITMHLCMQGSYALLKQQGFPLCLLAAGGLGHSRTAAAYPTGALPQKGPPLWTTYNPA